MNIKSLYVMFATFFIYATPVFSQGGGASGAKGFNIGSFLPMLLVMFVIIYFLMIRPEQKKQKQKQNMLGNLKKGDKVLTIGGIYGTVGNVKDDYISIKIADNTSVKVSKSAISNVIDKKKIEKK